MTKRPRLLHGKALGNYLNFLKADCVGGDPAYAPLLDRLRREETEPGPPRAYARIALLKKDGAPAGYPLFEALVRDALSAATATSWRPTNGLIQGQALKTLKLLERGHGRRLFSTLGMRGPGRGGADARLEDLWRRFLGVAPDLRPRVRGLERVLNELDKLAGFYASAAPSERGLIYREFPRNPFETMVQPGVDCCLFNGRSRHRAAAVAFLAHPAARLMALYSEAEGMALGATIEADMLDENGARVRVVDSVEIGASRRRFAMRHSWIPLTVQGVIHRALAAGSRCQAVFFNTGYEPRYERGYLSHEAGREMAEWLKARFPVVRIPLRIVGGLAPLQRMGAVNPKINLEVLSTKRLDDMFNNGEGRGVGVRIDLDDTDLWGRVGCDYLAGPLRVQLL